MDKPTISCRELKQLRGQKADLFLLDVRDEQKYAAGSLHLDGIVTRNAPYIQMKEKEQPLDDDTMRACKEALIVTVCTTGNKAQKAAALLREKGFRALALEGGLTSWNDSTELE